MSEHLDPQQARDLLDKAEQLGAASRSGAGWPHIALLLGLGGVSSMFAIALYLVVRADESLIWLPMVVMAVWLLILTAVMVSFSRSSKTGFGRRWRTAILAWAVAWVITIIGGTVWWKGQLWFALASALLLTAITTWGALREARQ